MNEYNDYWEPPSTEELEEAFEESGRPGCLSVFAVLLAAGGIGYGIVFGIMGLNLIVDQPGRPALGALITLSAIPLMLLPAIVAVGLWRLRMWAWWLTVISLSLGLGAALLSFSAAFLDPARAIGFVLGPLMGLLVAGIVLYWFLINRKRFRDDEVAYAGGRATEATNADNALLIFAVTAIGCTTLFCLVGVFLVAIPFLFGLSPTGILRSLGLPAP